MIPKMRSQGINRHGTGINPHVPWQINHRVNGLDYLQRYFYGWQTSDYSTVYIAESPTGMVARKYMLPEEGESECVDCYDPPYAFCGDGYCDYHHSNYCDGNC